VVENSFTLEFETAQEEWEEFPDEQVLGEKRPAMILGLSSPPEKTS